MSKKEKEETSEEDEQKEKRKKANKKYYEKNKEDRYVKCFLCKKDYTKNNKTAHLKTKHHIYEEKKYELENTIKKQEMEIDKLNKKIKNKI